MEGHLKLAILYPSFLLLNTAFYSSLSTERVTENSIYGIHPKAIHTINYLHIYIGISESQSSDLSRG